MRMRFWGGRYVRINAETPIYIMLIGMMVIQLFIPLRISFMVSLGIWAIFASSIFSFVVAGIPRKKNNQYLFIVLVMILNIFFSMLCAFALSYRGLVVALSFLEIPLFMAAYPNINNSSIRKAVYRCFVILSVYYIILSFTSLSNIYYMKYGVRQMEFLTLGYNNPNETAMYLFACLIVLVSLWFELKTFATKVFLAVDIALILRLLWLTLSRTGVLLGVLFLVLTLCFRKNRIPNFVRNISVMIPLVFLFLTLTLNEWLLNWNVLGEQVETGRGAVYGRVIENLDLLAILVGRYNFYFENLHNAFWTIFATIGIFGTALYWGFMNSKFRVIQNQIKVNDVGKVALIGLLCIFVYTSTEAAFLTSGGTFAAMFISIYLLSVK